MRMKKIAPRARKPERAKHSSRSRTAIAGLGVALAVTGAVAASMFTGTSAAPAAPAPASTLSPERAAENRRAQAELAAPAAMYAGAASARPSAAKTPIVTLTGCLEQHGDDYRLKDAAGTDAPKARSWKSGFLKKSTPALDVVDRSNRLKLKQHVGERVSVSGVLVDREMQARSLKGVAPACN